MHRLTFTLIVFLGIALSLKSQPPAGYYSSTSGLYGDSLREALHNIIDGHSPMTYDQLHGLYPYTDARPDNTVWDMYSDVPGGTPPYVYHFTSADQCGNYSQEGDCYNREHSFPKSWFGGQVMPMHTDMFHVYPTDGYVNGQRGNLPYGETGSPSWTSMNGSKRGPCSVGGYNGEVFEPIDEYKGDLARSYFYMAVRYYGEDNGWPGSPMVNGAEPLPWALSMLLQWHQQDSVSQKEISRNNAVYAYQGNRNPFIDDPYFAERIWVTSAGLKPKHQRPMLRINPVPARDKINLHLSGKGNATYSAQLLDATGRVSGNAVRIRPGELRRLDISHLSAGFCIIELSNEANSMKWHYKVLLSN